MRVNILPSSRCWWWARFLHRTLFDASKYSFEILVFCIRILSVSITVPPSSQGHFALSINLKLWRYEVTCMSMNTASVNLDETYEGYIEGYCEGNSSVMETEFLYCEQRLSSSILH